MNTQIFKCASCGAPLPVAENAQHVTCEYCQRVQMVQPEKNLAVPRSNKSRLITFLLCLFLGVFGAHRFYTGHIRTGILQLISLGGLGFWWLADLFKLGWGGYKDSKGLLLIDDHPALVKCLFVGFVAYIGISLLLNVFLPK